MVNTANVKFTDNQIIPSTIGDARIKDLDINWTTATEVNETLTYGDDIIDATTGQPTRLPGKSTFDSLTLTTPRTKAAERKIREWLKKDSSKSGNVAVTVVIADIYYSYSKCSMSRVPISPAFDKNGNQTTANILTVVVEVSNYSKTEIRFNG
jgi:hypothetical protein